MPSSRAYDREPTEQVPPNDKKALNTVGEIHLGTTCHLSCGPTKKLSKTLPAVGTVGMIKPRYRHRPSTAAQYSSLGGSTEPCRLGAPKLQTIAVDKRLRMSAVYYRHPISVMRKLRH